MCFWKIFKGAKKEEYEDARKNLQKKKREKHSTSLFLLVLLKVTSLSKHRDTKRTQSLVFSLARMYVPVQPRSQGFFPKKMGRAGKGPGIDRSVFFSDSLVAMLQLV